MQCVMISWGIRSSGDWQLARNAWFYLYPRGQTTIVGGKELCDGRPRRFAKCDRVDQIFLIMSWPTSFLIDSIRKLCDNRSNTLMMVTMIIVNKTVWLWWWAYVRRLLSGCTRTCLILLCEVLCVIAGGHCMLIIIMMTMMTMTLVMLLHLKWWWSTPLFNMMTGGGGDCDDHVGD